MRITLAYNLRQEESENQAELLTEEDVDRLGGALRELGHEVAPVEMTGSTERIVDALVTSRPELIFNVAEGVGGPMREALYPALYRQLGLPFTGGGTSLLLIDLDKRLAEKVLALRGIRVPRGVLVTAQNRDLPADLVYPLIIKPNYEGSGKGIHQSSVVSSPEQAGKIVDGLLEAYPEGLDVEEYIPGRELTVPMLESWPDRLLEVVEHVFSGVEHPIYDYELKKSGEAEGKVRTVCPAPLSVRERQEVLALADQVFQAMPCPDLGRVDIRLRDDGTPYFIEINPLPSLHPGASLMTAARAKGLDFTETIGLIVRSAVRRYGLDLGLRSVRRGLQKKTRPACRDLGITIGRFETGRWNAVTDVEGIRVGHVTHCRDDVPVPGKKGEKTSVRTGITAVVPGTGDLFNNHLVAGGFVLNGIGEMSGLTQAMEWGWLETPILLSNTMSVGLVHAGIIRHMIKRHPELGRKVDVIIPLVGETNDAFLNDARVLVNTPGEAMKAIRNARSGPVAQGSVGGGTGMITFDFAGGIGTSSRMLPREDGGYTVGVLVQSNFGKMHNLTIEGAVIGRELDRLYPREGRRGKSYGSVIVIVVTDAPLLSTHLKRLAKRAALGLGRVGSYAATTSGEIIFAFSTGNRASREAKEISPELDITFVNDSRLNLLFEAVIEATEEAVLNAMFCSAGMSGRLDRYAPPIPNDLIREILTGRRRLAGEKIGNGESVAR